MTDGGDPFAVRVEGPFGPVDAKLTDNDDGSYSAEYLPEDPGDHSVHVTLNGVELPESPWTVSTSPAADGNFINKFHHLSQRLMP